MFIDETTTNVEICKEIMNSKKLSDETKIKAIQAIGIVYCSRNNENNEEEILMEG